MKNLPSELELLNLVELHGSVAKAATHLGVSKRSLQRKIKKIKESDQYKLNLNTKVWTSKWDNLKTFAEIKEDTEKFEDVLSLPLIEGTSPVIEGDVGAEHIKALRDDLGLSEEEFELASASIKKWEAQGAEDTVKELSSISASFRSNKPINMILPAERTEHEPNINHVVNRTKNDNADKQLWVVCGDEQVPFNSKEMEKSFKAFLEQVKPTHGVMVGDMLDFPTISKYPDNPEWDGEGGPQECVDQSYQILVDRLYYSPDTSWSFIEGNHDARLRLELLRRAERLYGLRPGMAAGETALEPLLTVKRLLRLDELGIEYVQAKGNYTHGAKFITDDLCVIHGDKTGPSAIKNMMDEVDYSIIQGHNHKAIRLSKTYKTKDGHRVQHGVGLGTMAEIDGGTGYTARPNWQNHFVTVTVDKSDNSFHIEDAWFDGKNIVWRGNKF